MNAQRQGEAVWLAALASRPRGVKRSMDDKVTLQVEPITPKELYQAQKEDPAIRKVIEHKQSGKQPTLQDRQRAPPDLRFLLREWKKQKWLKCTTCSSSEVSYDSIQGVT